jgi:hypothetical protein
MPEIQRPIIDPSKRDEIKLITSADGEMNRSYSRSDDLLLLDPTYGQHRSRSDISPVMAVSLRT